MVASSNLLQVNHLNIQNTPEVKLVISSHYQRLRKACDRIKKCQIRMVNIARNRKLKAENSYLVSINLTMAGGFDLYILRSPKENHQESLQIAITEAFAQVYRRLIELRLEEKITDRV